MVLDPELIGNVDDSLDGFRCRYWINFFFLVPPVQKVLILSWEFSIWPVIGQETFFWLEAVGGHFFTAGCQVPIGRVQLVAVNIICRPQTMRISFPHGYNPLD